MRRLLFVRLVAFLLLTLAVGMGPGVALAEARAHAETGQQQAHGQREHFEARGGQDHADHCAVGVASAAAKPSPAVPATVRAPLVSARAVALVPCLVLPSDPVRLHPTRGPPAR